MNQPIIGCVQLNSQKVIDDNLSIISNATKKAELESVHLLVLPENACKMGGQKELGERFDEISTWYANLAAKHQMFILAGTLPCPYRPDGTPVPNDKLRQVSQMFAPDGKRIARYDKIHLFKAEVADSTGSYDEGRTFEAGNTTVVATCDIANLLGSTNTTINTRQLSVGMMVCFDLRFPALAQRLHQAGADILTAPSAFTYQTGKAHWELLLKARALDAQCMLVGSAQGGTHYGNNSSRDTWGHSAIANANGELFAKIDQTKLSTEYALITAPFDKQAQQIWRQNMPIHHCHRLC